MAGKVIGINTAIVAQGQGIGFAIPMNMAKSILSDLKTKGIVTRGWLGISVQDISEDIAKNLNHKNKNGALVSEVFKDDPADKAGIKVGDVIVEINGKSIKDTHELLLTIASLHVGEKVLIKGLRDGKEISFQVVVAERKDKPEIALTKKSGGYFGISAQEITKDLAKQMGISHDAGVIVTDVEEGSPADDVGIQTHDIIVQVNKVKVSSMKKYTTEMNKAAEKKSVILLVKRGKSNFFVGLHIE
jgi:serine protease Do